MNGPQHFEEAENLLAMASETRCAIQAGDPTAGPPDEPALLVAEAQAHATLAGVYAHNRATTELIALLQTVLGELRETREAAESSAEVVQAAKDLHLLLGIRELKDRLAALERDTPQARQVEHEADLAAAGLAESGADERGDPVGTDRHGPGCGCPWCYDPDESEVAR